MVDPVGEPKTWKGERVESGQSTWPRTLVSNAEVGRKLKMPAVTLQILSPPSTAILAAEYYTNRNKTGSSGCSCCRNQKSLCSLA